MSSTVDETVDETDEGEDLIPNPVEDNGHALQETTTNDRAPEPSEAQDKPAAYRVAWSDGEDSDDAYKAFKDRKKIQRRRQQPQKRKANIGNGASDAAADDRSKRPRRDQHSLTERRAKGVADDHDEETDDGFMPSYLRKRKAEFETRREKLRTAGLRLPPAYDDVAFSDDERLAHLKERPIFPRSKPAQSYRDRQLPHSLGVIPAPVAQWLRDYQVEGVAFLHRLFVYQSGGILGDDMGLGKTIQVIAFLTVAFGKTGDERDRKRMRKLRRAKVDWYPRVLIVCPGTLIENWKAEFERWGWWHVDVYHGNHKEEALQAASSGRLEILITTYTTYRTHRSAINCVNWDCVVADECHNIKGHHSETTKAMDEVNALCRIGLTGTAIQNTYEELWVLLNWAVPGRFGHLTEWRKTISEPLRVGQSHEATLHQLGKARKIAKALVENLLPPFFLRRMKSLIADQLPKKSDRVIFCPLTETQVGAYTAFVQGEVVRYIMEASQSCDCGSGKKKGWCHQMCLSDGTPWKQYVFPAIMNLQKISNHLASLIPQGTDPVDKQKKDLALLKQALPDEWQHLYSTRGSILHYSNPAYCGKWKVLRKLLKFWHDAGDKVLVFSHSVRLLRMLRQLFQHTAYNVAYFDGAMSYQARDEAVTNFNADSSQFVFLISTRAGGVGLNITAANKVVIVDPHWNPAWDLQAQDRAYRLGQLRDVDVFRLVSAGTIEEIVYARQIYKQQQANIGYTASTERRYFAGVQNKSSGELFGLENLFAPPAAHGVASVLEAIVHKTNVAEARAGVTAVAIDMDAASQETPLPSSLDDMVPAPGDPDDPLLAAPDADPALAALAELIAEDPDASPNTKKKKKPPPARASAGRSDPVQAILTSAGVAYSHVNSEVVGPSRVEAHLSARATATGNEVGMGDSRLFPVASSQVEQDDEEAESPGNDSGEDGGATEPAGNTSWRYRPPAEVRRRQFCSMAKTWGYASATAFALVVEGWTSGQRRAALDQFYARRRKEFEAKAAKDDADDEEAEAGRSSEDNHAVQGTDENEPDEGPGDSWAF